MDEDSFIPSTRNTNIHDAETDNDLDSGSRNFTGESKVDAGQTSYSVRYDYG